jgi:hypothetical protein
VWSSGALPYLVLLTSLPEWDMGYRGDCVLWHSYEILLPLRRPRSNRRLYNFRNRLCRSMELQSNVTHPDFLAFKSERVKWLMSYSRHHTFSFSIKQKEYSEQQKRVFFVHSSFSVCAGFSCFIILIQWIKIWECLKLCRCFG